MASIADIFPQTPSPFRKPSLKTTYTRLAKDLQQKALEQRIKTVQQLMEKQRRGEIQDAQAFSRMNLPLITDNYGEYFTRLNEEALAKSLSPEQLLEILGKGETETTFPRPPMIFADPKASVRGIPREDRERRKGFARDSLLHEYITEMLQKYSR